MPSDLTHTEVKALIEPGRHRVSKGLYLQVDGGSRSWIHRYMLNGHSHDMGLGSYDLITLAKARDLVIDARRLAAAGRGVSLAARARRHALWFGRPSRPWPLSITRRTRTAGRTCGIAFSG